MCCEQVVLSVQDEGGEHCLPLAVLLLARWQSL